MWQQLVSGIILMAAVSYAAWRAYKMLLRADDPCYGCNGCPLKDRKRRKNDRKRAVCNKKTTQKFGSTE